MDKVVQDYLFRIRIGKLGVELSFKFSWRFFMQKMEKGEVFVA